MTHVLHDILAVLKARQEAFSNELCSYPPALFDHKPIQCSGAMSELADAIWRQVDLEHIEKPSVVFPQRETNDISIREAHVTTRQIIDGVCYYTAFHGVSVT